MPFNNAEILEKAKKEGRAKLKEYARKLAKEQPEVFRRGVSALLDGIPTGRDLTKERRELQSLTDPEILKKAIEARIKATSEQETFEMLFGGRE